MARVEEELRSPLRAILQHVLREAPEPPLELVSTIVFEKNGMSFPYEERPSFIALIGWLLEWSKDSTEVEELLFALRNNDDLARNLLVDGSGNPLQESIEAFWVTQYLIAPLIREYLSKHPNREWDDSFFETQLSRVADYVSAEALTYRTTSPLIGFSSSVDRIDLSDRIAIRPLREDERRAAWEETAQHALFIPMGPDPHDFIDATYGIQVRYEGRKHEPIGPISEPSTVLTVLRILKTGGIHLGWTRIGPSEQSYSMGGPMGWTVSESLPTYRPSLSYGLEVADVEPLQELFAKYAGRAQDEAFDLAVRRFNSAYTRSNAEDRLIDYWVALEALFLPDTQEELSYRIALRLAAFCGDEGDSRIRYFDDARESYKARSRVIHGRAVARLDEITAATEQMVRVSLGRWIDPTRDHNPDFLEKFLLRNGSSE